MILLNYNEYKSFRKETGWGGCMNILMYLLPILKELNVKNFVCERKDDKWFWHYFELEDGTKLKIKACLGYNGCDTCNAKNYRFEKDDYIREHIFSNKINMNDIKERIASIKEWY